METTVEIPEGKALVKIDNDTYKLVDANKVLPNTWEEYCDTHPIEEGEYFIDRTSLIWPDERVGSRRVPLYSKNLLSSREQAEAFRALMQLVRLRDCYNESASYKDEEYEVVYDMVSKDFVVHDGTNDRSNHVLTFNTKRLAEQFLANFRDLIETAKELI